MTYRRRDVIAALAGAGSATAAGCGMLGSQSGPRPPELPDAVGVEPIATGIRAPVDVAFAAESDRRYVADQSGVVYTHGADGRTDDPFLDLRDAVTFGGEKGLLGIALHPDFASNRRVFVRYSAPSRAGTPANYSHTFVLAEFEATADGTRARPETERTILELPQPQPNHNAGSVGFGPDGFLYVGVGDGGAGGDQGLGHVADWYDAVPGGNGQDVTENLLGSILRIDVDGSQTLRGSQRHYAVPDDNPLVDQAGLAEHYAWGFRNPWRFSFDRGRLFVGDVGQREYEEVDLVRRGGNYGWNVREGRHCFQADTCPDATPESVRGGEPLVDPIIEYPHGGAPVSGQSVIGGHVYRGSAIPGLQGAYVFGDLRANGDLFVATQTDDDQWTASVLPIASGDADAVEQIRSFGADGDGEMYVLSTGSDGGGVYRLTPA